MRNRMKWSSPFLRLTIPLILVLLSLAPAARAVIGPPGPDDFYGPTNVPLASWSFWDNTGWTDDESNAPISFTNLAFSYLGDGASLVVNTNIPAWLNYYIYEPGTGATNLVVNGPGSITFWYAPADWSSTAAGGTGPGEWTQLIDVGEWTANSSEGYWGLSVDSPGSNLWFVAQDGAGNTYTLSTPISWTTNYFHFVTLTYSATNVSIFLDGQIATNDPGGLSVWPGSAVLSTGVFFGSDPNGLMQAQGLFNTVQTYNYPLDTNDVQAIFDWEYVPYEISPWNTAMANLTSAPSSPSPAASTYNIITGQGVLQLAGTVSGVNGTNAYNIWITNEMVTTVGTNANVTFTIQGGAPGVPYDVFANSVLSFGTNGTPWAWEGQGYQGGVYTITNIPSTTCFLILGTPLDPTDVGLTEAYELLVSKTNPNTPDTTGDGIADSDAILEGLNPLVSYTTWKLDTDDDGLPDAYETSVGLNPNVAEAPPVLPASTPAPLP